MTYNNTVHWYCTVCTLPGEDGISGSGRVVLGRNRHNYKTLLLNLSVEWERDIRRFRSGMYFLETDTIIIHCSTIINYTQSYNGICPG